MDFDGIRSEEKRGRTAHSVNRRQKKATRLSGFFIMLGAGNETCIKALSLCFPTLFFTTVSSEGLNYSLILSRRQQELSNDFHDRPYTSPPEIRWGSIHTVRRGHAGSVRVLALRYPVRSPQHSSNQVDRFAAWLISTVRHPPRGMGRSSLYGVFDWIDGLV